MVVRQSRNRREPREIRGNATRLEWPGRNWEPRSRSLSLGAIRMVTTEEARNAGTSGDERVPSAARLVHGDALDVARALVSEGLEGHVDLVYIDPPFASQAAYVHEARVDGPADGRVVRAMAYDDRWEGEGLGGYLDMLAPRLEVLASLLAPTGTIWVHVDWRASYFVRLMLDEIVGRDGFVNEIVWRRAPNLGRQAASHQFGRTLDTIVVYGKSGARLVPPTRLEPIAPAAIRWDPEGRPFTAAPRGDYTDESIARLEEEGRIHRTATGKVYVKYFLVKDDDGAWCRRRRVDALWTDIAPLRHSSPGERTGFPTQKPRALLDRIVTCASPPGGLVLDLFAGSGTTGESASALGRRFVLGDASPLALATARSRLLRAGAELTLQECGIPTAACSPNAAEGPCISAGREGERVRVELRHPIEPLAWAVDTRYDASRPFRAVWHSERVPGARARPAERSALLDRSSGPLAVRVWYDDGGVATRFVEQP